jgi:hypothetical protein
MVQIEKVKELLEQISLICKQDKSIDRAALVIKLKRIFPSADPADLALAINTHLSRPAALDKLGTWASSGIFSPELLEQASRLTIAKYRASYFKGCNHVLEIGTGTGSDTAALAQVVNQVTTLEADPIRSAMAEENLRLQGIHNVTYVVGDLESKLSGLDLRSFDGLFADPARRSRSGDRVRESDDYYPPLSQLIELPFGRVRAIKVSPGLFFNPENSGWVREFLGHRAECLEQTLLFGTDTIDSSIRLTDLEISWSPPKNHTPINTPDTITGYICEAHATINRSQFLAAFFAQHGIAQMAPDLAYGITSERPERTPLMESFKIIHAMPFSQRALKEHLAQLGWSNRTELKKRNSSVDLDELRVSLRLPTHKHSAHFGTVFICKWRGAQHAIITERLSD